jgi:hypothetical protein
VGRNLKVNIIRMNQKQGIGDRRDAYFGKREEQRRQRDKKKANISCSTSQDDDRLLGGFF